MSLYNLGVGNYSRSGGRNTFGTLAELEADLREAREKGAPDDALILGTGPGSIYVAEVQWISKGEPDDKPDDEPGHGYWEAGDYG